MLVLGWQGRSTTHERATPCDPPEDALPEESLPEETLPEESLPEEVLPEEETVVALAQLLSQYKHNPSSFIENQLSAALF